MSSPDSIKDFKLCQLIKPIPLIGPMICNKPEDGKPDNSPAGLFNKLIKGTPLEEPKKGIDKFLNGTPFEGIDSFYIFLGLLIGTILFIIIIYLVTKKKYNKEEYFKELYNFPIPPPPPPPPINFRLSPEFQ